MWYNDIFIAIMNESVFLKCEKLFENFGVTSWYQSLSLRDSDAPSGVSELKLRI